MSFNEKYTQDNYMRPDEIDARNVARLMAVVDKWEAGQYESIWLVLHDVYEIVEWINPLRSQSVHQRYPDGNNDWAQKDIERERNAFSAYIKPAFLDKLSSDDVQSALRGFKRRLDESEGELTSFAIAALIFDSVSIDGDGGKTPEGFSKLSDAIQKNFGTWVTWANKQPNPFHGVIATLKEQERQFKNPPKKVDLFHYDGPEPETAFKKRLEPHIAELRTWCQEQGITERVIGNISADASGSVAFRPHVFNYNFLRDCAEKDALFDKEAKNPSRYPEDRFFDFEEKEFDPEHSFHKEYIYPYPVVYVTTYAVTFFPQNVGDIERLEALLKKAFEILEKIDQRFGNPIHYSSATKYEHSNPMWISAKDGSIPIEDRVDLDDLYNLYYLLEEVIVPSATIARTLNAATLLEARSPIKTHDALGEGHDYSVANSPKIDQMGEVRRLEQGLEDIFRLYALGKLDEKGFVQQTMNLADMSLMGQIPNQPKALLTYEGMAQRAESEGRDVVPYATALTDLTHVFMKAMASVAPNTQVESIGNMVFQAVAKKRDGIVTQLQAHDLSDMDAATNRVWGRTSGVNLDTIGDEVNRMMSDHEKALTISDALSGYNPNYYEGKEGERARAVAPSTAHRLAVRDPDIEPCIARNFDDTPYTSRMSGDPFPRLELPKRLQSFLTPEHTPVAQQALLSFKLK